MKVRVYLLARNRRTLVQEWHYQGSSTRFASVEEAKEVFSRDSGYPLHRLRVEDAHTHGYYVE